MSDSPITDPRGRLLPGLAALALFALLAFVFLGSSVGAGAGGFGATAEGNVTESIGYALFDLEGTQGTIEADGFLAAFEIIDFVLVGALLGAVMLAKREGAGVLTDGGEDEGGER